ncbi:hypothetical protein [Arthrobacter nitrophenolicus]|jgi:hypothetical protein|uniref:Uncharacterized protein n=2 Tax=Arthrobacter nitrophenolicus TaxID=683150 RepID=A0ACC6TKR8_9MICC|nr:hypothetical protein [Arthrobacter nitrophenolicus]ELT42665.1 hypothetical protein G205_23037 [Arthrobacter nitrophenolicus]
MPISIGHRAIFRAFRHRSNFALRTDSPACITDKPQQPAAAPAVDEFQCSPWEGLYLEQTHPVTPVDADNSISRQLDVFLAELMQGTLEN